MTDAVRTITLEAETRTLTMVGENASVSVINQNIAILTSVDQGPVGATGRAGRDGINADAVTDPGDLTLLFDNRII